MLAFYQHVKHLSTCRRLLKSLDTTVQPSVSLLTVLVPPAVNPSPTLRTPHIHIHNPHTNQVIISDVDVMWLRDPIPFFKKFPDADVLTSTDHLTPTIGGAETLERWPDAGSAFNIGGS